MSNKSQIKPAPKTPADSNSTQCAVSRRTIPLNQAIILKKVKANDSGEGPKVIDTGEQLSINRLLVKVHVSSQAKEFKKKYGEGNYLNALRTLGILEGSTKAETTIRVNGNFSEFRKCFAPGGEIPRGCELLVGHVIEPSLV
mgnify:CR=1 FL=1